MTRFTGLHHQLSRITIPPLKSVELQLDLLHELHCLSISLMCCQVAEKKYYLSFRDFSIFYQDSESWLLFLVKCSRSSPSLLEAIKASTCLNCSELGTNICSLTVFGLLQKRVLRCTLKTYSWQHADRWIALPKVCTGVQWIVLCKLFSLQIDLSHLGDFSMKTKLNLQVGQEPHRSTLVLLNDRSIA